jgi:hypothetical protein
MGYCLACGWLSGGCSQLATTLAVLLAALVLVTLVLGGIYFINPQHFRVKAALTKWFSLDIEVKNPSARSPRKQVTSSDEPPNSASPVPPGCGRTTLD